MELLFGIFVIIAFIFFSIMVVGLMLVVVLSGIHWFLVHESELENEWEELSLIIKKSLK